jgi:hypothetical protein
MVPSACVVVSAVITCAAGFLTLVWSPIFYEEAAGPIKPQHRAPIVAFGAIATAIIVGAIKGSYWGFLLVGFVGVVIGVLAGSTLPRSTIGVSYNLSLVGIVALVAMALA